MAGNIGHITATDAQSRATAAVRPLAAFAALWLGLTVVKRVISLRRPESTPDTERPQVPGSAESAAIASLRATLARGRKIHWPRRIS